MCGLSKVAVDSTLPARYGEPLEVTQGTIRERQAPSQAHRNLVVGRDTHSAGL